MTERVFPEPRREGTWVWNARPASPTFGGIAEDSLVRQGRSSTSWRA